MAYLFWAKRERDKRDGLTLSLIAHSADVAACLEALLDQQVIGRRLARLAGLAELTPRLKARLCVFTALHDWGKVNHGFQAKSDPTRRWEWCGHIAPAVALLCGDLQESTRAINALGLEELERWGTNPDSASSYLLAAMSHHGRPVDIEVPGSEKRERNWTPVGRIDPVAGIGELAASIRLWFPLAFETGADLPDHPAFQHYFAGLVMLADWIGSTRNLFVLDPAAGADRIEFSRSTARRALREIGFDSKAARLTQAAGIGDWLTCLNIATPRPEQRLIDTLPLPLDGGLFQFEAETGSGKTEAALRFFQRLFAVGLIDGLYFALPTRSAASQIYRRVGEAAQRMFGTTAPPVILALPGYFVVDGIVGQKGLAPFEVLWPDGKNDRDSTTRFWTAEHAKRYLAAAIAVGTIDQVLLSGLAVNHAHMRAACLSRHLLVVDEVHASDPYMRAILKDVIERHTRSGGYVLLMSATLGAAARDMFSGRPLTSLDEAITLPYPSFADAAGVHPIPDAQEEGRVKTVKLEEQPWMGDATAIAHRAAKAVEAGARVLIIRNTVADAIATQLALEDLLGLEHPALFRIGKRGTPALHHARYAPEDRRRLDAEVEYRFGRDSSAGSMSLVATQTVEQSLDIDADFLITDLCPMDVLLQRIGRLHRHARSRPTPYADACLLVLTPGERNLSNNIGRDGRACGRHGLSDHVYADLRIIEATWRDLEAGSFVIPTDNRRLVEAATHPEALDRVVQSVDSSWRRHAETMAGIRLAKEGQADLHALNDSVCFGNGDERFPSGDQRIATRLGAEDRLLSLDPPAEGPFGSISALRIPGWMVRESDLRFDGIEMEMDSTGAKRLIVDTGPTKYIYDRLGLRFGKVRL